jgi:DNA-binding NarL/FixJ family response regulator
MKVLIADDHWVVRETLKLTVKQLGGDVETLEASTFEQIRSALSATPEVALVLIDLIMPGFKDFSGLARLRAEFPEAPIAIVSVHEEPAFVTRAIAHGVIGYIPKSADAAEMRRALSRLLAGEVAFPRHILERARAPAAVKPASSEPAGPAAPDEETAELGRLTDREREIAALLGQGLSVARIAERLGLAPHTVRVHINNITRKLGLADRAETAHFAMRHAQSLARAG